MNKIFEKYQKYDIRTLERKFQNGKISKDEYEKFLESFGEETNYEEIDEEELRKSAGIIEEKNCAEETEEEKTNENGSD